MTSTSASDTPTVALLGQPIQKSTAEITAEPVRLPLLGCIVKANVVGSISHVTLTQCFHNSHSDELEITYCFPLIEGSTVCGFKLEYESGAVINGVVKERDQAVKDFTQAKKCGLKAGLLESDRPDVFKLSLGLLAAGEHVKIDITYISILKIENDDICFVFPTSIAPLYCPLHSSAKLSDDTSASTVIFDGQHVEVSFRAMSPIISLSSPSHDDSASISISGSSAVATMSNIPRGSDIILICKEERSNEPRALLEIGPDDSVVGLVMLNPKVDPIDTPAQEFVFIVDRSGSMGGQQIDQAKEALLLLLRGLPVGSSFDIISFGSTFASLFGEPRRYDDDALEVASQHAAGMAADMGGTEILAPLQHALAKPPPGGRVRNVFLLTDGAASNANEVFAAVEAAVSPAAPGDGAAGAGEAPGRSRVFALGVGDTVSHHLVNGVARAGGGTARFVRAGQDMRGPVLEQLKQAMHPALDRVTVTWNFADAAPPPPLPHVADSDAPPAALPGDSDGSGGGGGSQAAQDGPATGRVQHLVPARPRPVFAGEHFLSFAIFAPAPAGGPLPQSVTVAARWASSSAPLSATVPLAEGSACRGVAVHRLAAREAIRELEEGGAGGAAGGRAAIARLAVAQGLVSSATALVAVEAATGRAVAAAGARTEAGQAAAAGAEDPQAARWKTYEYSCNSNLVLTSTRFRRRTRIVTVSGSDSDSDRRPEGAALGPTARKRPRSETGGTGSDSDAPLGGPGLDAQAQVGSTGSMLGPAMSSVPSSDEAGTAPPAPAPARGSAALASPGGVSGPVAAAVPGAAAAVSAGGLGSDGLGTEADGAARLCLLQRADGRFLAGPALDSALGLAPGASAALRTAAAARCGLLAEAGGGSPAAEGGDDALWATAVAVAAARTRFAGVQAVWGLMEAKALAALAQLCAKRGAGAAEVEAAVAVVCALLRG